MVCYLNVLMVKNLYYRLKVQLNVIGLINMYSTCILIGGYL